MGSYYVRVFGFSNLGQTGQFDYTIKVTEGCDLVNFGTPEAFNERQSIALNVGTLEIDSSFEIRPASCQELALTYEVKCYTSRLYRCSDSNWFHIDSLTGALTITPSEVSHVGEFLFKVKVWTALGQLETADFHLDVPDGCPENAHVMLATSTYIPYDLYEPALQTEVVFKLN